MYSYSNKVNVQQHTRVVVCCWIRYSSAACYLLSLRLAGCHVHRLFQRALENINIMRSGAVRYAPLLPLNNLFVYWKICVRAVHSCTPILGRCCAATATAEKSLFSPCTHHPSPRACYPPRHTAEFTNLYNMILYDLDISYNIMICLQYIYISI